MTPFHPILLIAIVGIAVALVLGHTATTASTSARRILLVCLALPCLIPAWMVLAAIRPEWVDSRFRTYKAFYRDIHEGMTRQEVDALLSRYYPSAGPRAYPKILEDTPQRLGLFMNPETSTEPNCEGISLKFEDGRVAAKDYSPD